MIIFKPEVDNNNSNNNNSNDIVMEDNSNNNIDNNGEGSKLKRRFSAMFSASSPS